MWKYSVYFFAYAFKDSSYCLYDPQWCWILDFYVYLTQIFGGKRLRIMFLCLFCIFEYFRALLAQTMTEYSQKLDHYQTRRKSKNYILDGTYYNYWKEHSLRLLFLLVYELHPSVWVSDCQYGHCNSPEFNSSILRDRGIRGMTDEAVLNKVL